MASPRETTFELILRLAYRDYEEHRDPKNRYRMICPVCNHIPSGGGFTSFSIQSDQNTWYCFACDEGGAYPKMLAHLSGGAPIAFQTPKVSTRPAKSSSKPKPVPLQGATLKALSQKAGLPAEWCHEYLGWRDGFWYKTPAVEMPYYTSFGVEGPIRYRVGIDAQDRFRGRGKQILYGIWNLEYIRAMGYVIIVEGETDFATLYYHNYPVIAVPGASIWRLEHARLLEGIQVYLWREDDTGGTTLFTKVTETVESPLIIDAPAEAKDPNDLYLLEGDNFRERMEELLDSASPFVIPEVPERFLDQPEERWFAAHDQVRFRLWIDSLRDDAMLKKQLFVDTLPTETVNQRMRKNRIERCFESYRAKKCLNTGEIFLQRFKCNEPVCPFCAHGLLEQFFNQPGPDGQCKKDTIKAYMDDPTIYAVNLGSYKLPSDHVQKVKRIAAIEKDILAWNTRLTANFGKDYAVAKDHIRGIRTKTEGDVFHYQILFLANREGAAALEILRQHFALSTGVVPKVEEYTCHGVNNAVEMFTLMMGLRCDWDTAENYDLWRSATKGSKLIQGKGIYYKVSGGKKPKQLGLKLGDCPVCGTCTPVELGSTYPVASTQVEHFESEWTGKKYVVLKTEGMVA